MTDSSNTKQLAQFILFKGTPKIVIALIWVMDSSSIPLQNSFSSFHQSPVETLHATSLPSSLELNKPSNQVKLNASFYLLKFIGGCGLIIGLALAITYQFNRQPSPQSAQPQNTPSPIVKQPQNPIPETSCDPLLSNCEDPDKSEPVEPIDNSSLVKPPEKKIEFVSKIYPIPSDMQNKMMGVTWFYKCPIKLNQLVVLEVSHWDSQGKIVQGQLIVAADVAKSLQQVFQKLFWLKFPIHRMRPAHEFGGNDELSMSANNTSAFNCRPVEGTNIWSEHAYGKAVDINPLVNPYIKQGVILPANGKSYVKRNQKVQGMIHQNSAVVTEFQKIGWKWGGNWRSLKDYQHFSHNGQ